MSKHFDGVLHESFEKAREQASRTGQTEVSVEHVLYQIILNGSVSELFKDLRADEKAVKEEVKRELDALGSEDEPVRQEDMVMSDPLQKIVRRATVRLESLNNDREIKGWDIVSAILPQNDCISSHILQSAGLTKFDVNNWISHGQPKRESSNSEMVPAGDQGLEAKPSEGGESHLKLYATNLNEKAARGEIDPLIGREEELTRAIRTLCRRRKNNPLFVGDEGVGKTALAEGLAKLIHDGKAPEALKGSVVYSLEMGTMVAGCRYRGDFEERMKKLMDEVRQDPKAIIFIDEIHTLINAGSAGTGSQDAPNMLKPALQKGEFRCIGATTYKEFKKTFSKEDALNRRFQKIDVVEPSEEQAAEIIMGLIDVYEGHHGVTFSKEVVEASIKLSQRYIPHRRLPDKVIDIIDEIGSMYQSGEKKNLNAERIHVVTIEDVCEVVSKTAKVPVSASSKEDAEKYLELDFNLKASVFGQDQAVEAVAEAMKVSKAGLRSPDKPLANFLFLGPTGVGKTELSKKLAKELNLELLRFDMSEYQEKHSVARLVGAPPGYVGFDQGGLLTDRVDKHPHSVLLLDEIEKAHSDVYNLLLQVMDNGCLTDSQGREVNFRNVVLIMTSNVGAADLEKNSIGFMASDADPVQDNVTLNRTFTPEFRNRLDGIIPFFHLKKEDISMVVEKELVKLEKNRDRNPIFFEIEEDAKGWIIEKGYDKKMGARPMERVISKEVSVPLSSRILSGDLDKGGNVLIILNDEKNGLDFKISPAPQASRDKAEEGGEMVAEA